MIFETQRLIVRKLKMNDLSSFHKMQSNPKVLQYADGEVKSLKEDEIELKDLINKYEKIDNDFFIYAIENKKTNEFIGTVALVKDNNDDEIGYRFLEEFWGQGFGLEVCKGLVIYAKKIGLKKLIGYAVEENIASIKILEKIGFSKIESFINEEHQKEFKYQLVL